MVLLLIAGNGVAAATILGLGHGWMAVAPHSVMVWPWVLISLAGAAVSIFFLKLSMVIIERLQSLVARRGIKESTVTDPSGGWQEVANVLGVIAAAVSGALTLLIRKLKINSVPREEYNGTIESLRREIASSRQELVTRIDNGMDGINHRLDGLMLAIMNNQQKE